MTNVSNINYFYSSSGPERGGVILRDKSLKELNNAADDPLNEFGLGEEDQKYLDDPFVIGTFHTHPNGSSNLSVSDYLSFINYPRLIHYICGKDGIKAFVMQGGILIEK